MNANSARFCIDQPFKLWLVILFLVGWLLPMTAAAADLTVDCDNGESLQAAIDSLDPAGPNTITVSGTCEERIFIGNAVNLGYQGLLIEGPAGGGTATITPPLAGQSLGTVMAIGGSHAIWLDRLVIRGGRIGLQVYDQSEVDTSELTIEDNALAGATVGSSSILFFQAATIHNNGQIGVLTGNRQAGSVWFRGRPGAPTVIEGHSQCGVCLFFRGAAGMQGLVQVRNNGTAGDDQSAGILVGGNSALDVFSHPVLGNPEITDNTGHGILARVGSTVTVNGVTIANNTSAGIRIEGLSVADI